jgi:tight adherence protein B
VKVRTLARRLADNPWPTAFGLAAVPHIPVPFMAVASIGFVSILVGRRRGVRRREQARVPGDIATVGRVVLVALTAGLPLPLALELALTEVGRTIGAEVATVLRKGRLDGMAGALSSASGSLTRPLFARLALAQASGAPMTEAVTAFLAEFRAQRRMEAVTRMRRLPVTLMLPLGLLILPGFVVLFAGPIVVRSLADVFGAIS